MKKQFVYVLTHSDWGIEGVTMRIYATFEEAQKVMQREVKAYLKKHPDWEKDYQTENSACVHLLTYFFDRNTTWKINRATKEL